MSEYKVVVHSPPVVDDAFVRALFGTDIKGLAERIKRGEYKLPKKNCSGKKSGK